MVITILCTDPRHPIVPRLRHWVAEISARGHMATLVHDRAELPGGDILFLVSCSQLIRDSERRRYRAVLVLHASDLPRGRGWSPHVWAILEGAKSITVTLLEADDPVDSGRIWLQTQFELHGHELLPEINAKLFEAELALMTQAVESLDEIEPVAQAGETGPYLRRRTPEDSRLDPMKTIAEQFDLLRTIDVERYPAFFEYRGKRYIVTIKKDETETG